MKTDKYIIETDIWEVDAHAPIEISKTEFERQLKFLRDKVSKSKSEEWEYKVEEREPIVSENDAQIVTQYRFYFPSGGTYLIHRKCKNGYRFKLKGEK